jgi:adenylate cyclase
MAEKGHIRQVEAVFMFADLSGFTALVEMHGDISAAQIAARYTEITESVLEPGTLLVKTMGDEVMLVAEDVVSAVYTAVRLRQAVENEPLFPTVRIGLHKGSAVSQNGDYFGTAVNLSARVAAHARTGQILCTKEVATTADELDDIIGRVVELVQFKNVSMPVTVYEILSGTSTESSDTVDPICRMSIRQDSAPAQLPFAGEIYYFCSFECASEFIKRHTSSQNLNVSRKTTE